MNEQQPVLDQENDIENQEIEQSPTEKGRAWLDRTGKSASEALAAHGINSKSLNLVMRVTGLTILGERVITASSTEERASIIGAALLSYGWNKIRKRLEEKITEKYPNLTRDSNFDIASVIDPHTLRINNLTKQIKRGNYETNG